MIKIMTVDDSTTIRRVFKNTLPRIFCDQIEILEAENGKEALDILKSNPDIVLIFLDVNMPTMKGDEFLQIMRANQDYNDIKVIMATTEAEKKTVMKIMKIGANGFLVKPFNFERVVKALIPIVGRMGIEINEEDVKPQFKL
jgi:two-component system chemotaxis response regulator CheY